jgi:penicillin-binding protein 2
MLVPGVALAAKTGTAQVRRITMSERAGGVLKNSQLPFKMRDHALFVCFAPADKPKYAMAVVLEHNGHTVANLDTPLTGRDIMTYMFDRERAMASLAEVEPTWGGDIATRAAAEAAAYRAAATAPPPAVGLATEQNAGAPTDAPAVEAATAAANAAAEAQAQDTATGNGVAQTTGSPEPR